MAEIRNNGLNSVNQVKNLKFKGNQPALEKAADESKQINDLGNNPADMVGRTQVKKYEAPSFNGQALDPKLIQRLSGDISKLDQNPELVKKSDLVFQGALDKGYSYEDAVKMQNEFVNELSSK